MSDTLTLVVGAVAHGGHCVARHEGRVVFVRHALPGETVKAVITSFGPKGRYVRADAVDVIVASPSRVTPPCRYAGRCGGCDWQHAEIGYQRQLKADVVKEQLRRLGGIEMDVTVEPVESLTSDDLEARGLHWRTRVAFSVDESGELGFRRYRSHEVLAVDECLIAHPLVTEAVSNTPTFPPGERVEVAASVTSGETSVTFGKERATTLHERAASREWQVTGGFWQVHPGAADALVGAVQDLLQPATGEHVLDLYSGVGLFAGPIADAVGVGGRVDAVESAGQAVRDARVNIGESPQVHLHQLDVMRFLKETKLRRCDAVVLDPPRAGAGRGVLERVTRLSPRAICYVACDPASLGRDVAVLAGWGYSLAQVRVFDLFPMTHHVECVALFERASG